MVAHRHGRDEEPLGDRAASTVPRTGTGGFPSPAPSARPAAPRIVVIGQSGSRTSASPARCRSSGEGFCFSSRSTCTTVDRAGWYDGIEKRETSNHLRPCLPTSIESGKRVDGVLGRFASLVGDRAVAEAVDVAVAVPAPEDVVAVLPENAARRPLEQLLASLVPEDDAIGGVDREDRVVAAGNSVQGVGRRRARGFSPSRLAPLPRSGNPRRAPRGSDGLSRPFSGGVGAAPPPRDGGRRRRVAGRRRRGPTRSGSPGPRFRRRPGRP